MSEPQDIPIYRREYGPGQHPLAVFSPDIEQAIAKSREWQAFNAGMQYAFAELLTNSTGHQVIGRPVTVTFTWPAGPPDAEVLQGYIDAAKTAAERYEPW
jgi:hypothetical protein